MMKNSCYTVDGIDVRLVKTQVFDDNKTVRLHTTARYYDVAFDDMPEFLRNWIPIEMEGVPSYDHTAAEMGITLPPDNMGVTVKDKAPEEADDDENDQVLKLQQLYVQMVENQSVESEFYKNQLKKALLNLKDPKNTNNRTYIDQAKQINNIAGNVNKITITNMQMLTAGINLFKGKKKRKPKPNDGKTGNDNPKD